MGEGHRAAWQARVRVPRFVKFGDSDESDPLAAYHDDLGWLAIFLMQIRKLSLKVSNNEDVALTFRFKLSTLPIMLSIDFNTSSVYKVPDVAPAVSQLIRCCQRTAKFTLCRIQMN